MASDPFDDSPTNAAEFTVSEISGSIKRTVEDAFGHVRVRGEISGYRGPHSSGHAYFALKDDKARIEAVIWKGTFTRLKHRPEEGLEVIATGKITTFPGSSKYQIVIEAIEPAGAGALMALLEDRRRRLAAEGLFDAARKQELPFLPSVIGVVTSPTGAVIRDILHRIEDRFPLHVLVWPVRVQGEGSAAEVTAAILGFNALPTGGLIARPDLIIVARGGGSLEDLWGFNDEAVVRAAAGSMIPLIAAVGHETDWTLIDHVADRRAPTPTGAAEMAVPVKADLEAGLASLSARLKGAQSRVLTRRRDGLRSVMRALPTLDNLLAVPRQKLDRSGGALGRALSLNTANRRRRFEQQAARMTPAALLAAIREKRLALTERTARMSRAVERAMDRRRALTERQAAMLAATPRRLSDAHQQSRRRLDDAGRRSATAVDRMLDRHLKALAAQARVLQTLSYHAVLSRGFAVIRDAERRPISRAALVGPGQTVVLEFTDGDITAMTRGGPPSRERSPRMRKATDPDQETLL